jgi:hypothetical protein
MNKLVAGIAGAISIALFAPIAQAAPLSGTGASPSTGIASEIVPVHGWHITCQRDRYGWHRSRVWGREKCVPKRWKWKW